MIIISAIKDRFEELIYDSYGCHVLDIGCGTGYL